MGTVKTYMKLHIFSHEQKKELIVSKYGEIQICQLLQANSSCNCLFLKAEEHKMLLYRCNTVNNETGSRMSKTFDEKYKINLFGYDFRNYLITAWLDSHRKEK